MGRPNTEVVRQVYEAFTRRDIPAVMRVLAPDVEITQSGEIPWGGKYKGHDGALQFFAKLTQAITSAVALERLVDAGDHVVAIGRTQGTVNATRNHFDVQVAHVWAFKEGLVVRIEFYIDNPTMLAALK
jgi:ketosteroid isomerase-like protein